MRQQWINLDHLLLTRDMCHVSIKYVPFLRRKHLYCTSIQVPQHHIHFLHMPTCDWKISILVDPEVWSSQKLKSNMTLLSLTESYKKGCTGSFCKCCGNFLWFQVCNTISLLHLGYIDKSKYKVSINLTGLDKIAKFDSVILEVSYNMHFVFISKIGHANNIPLLQFMSRILRISRSKCCTLLLHATVTRYCYHWLSAL